MPRKRRTPATLAKVETVHPATPPSYVQYTKSDGELIKLTRARHEVEVRIYTPPPSGSLSFNYSSSYSNSGSVLIPLDVFEEMIAQYDALVDDAA